MGDEGEGHDPLDLRLRDRTEDAHEHRQPRRNEQRHPQRGFGEQQGFGADDRVDADLRQQSSEDRCHRGRCRWVGVGQPEGQREDRGLDAEAQQQEDVKDHLHIGRQIRDPLGQLRHVHGAACCVDDADRGEEDHRGHQRNDYIGDSRTDPLRRGAEGEQHIGGDEEHLEADVEVEQVSGEERVRNARAQHQIAGVEHGDRCLVRVVVGVLTQGVHEDAQCDQ